MSKPLWKILFLVIGALALWRTTTATTLLWQYHRLGPEVTAQVTHWELLPKGSKYALEAAFAYDYRGENYSSKTVFSKPYYLNRGSAEEQIKKMSGMAWTAYVDAAQPQYASLEKNLPLKESIYALCLIGIFLYFVYIRFHLELLNKHM